MVPELGEAKAPAGPAAGAMNMGRTVSNFRQSQRLIVMTGSKPFSPAGDGRKPNLMRTPCEARTSTSPSPQPSPLVPYQRNDAQNAQHFSRHSHSAFCLCGFSAILKTVGVCAFALGSGYAGLGRGRIFVSRSVKRRPSEFARRAGSGSLSPGERVRVRGNKPYLGPTCRTITETVELRAFSSKGAAYPS
jgi:hypothetical protein